MATATDLGDLVALMLEGLALSEASLRCEIVWAGETYPCTASPEKDGMRIDEGGYRPVRSVIIKVRTELFPSGIGLPAKKQTVQYRKNATADLKAYRIAEITDYYGAILEMRCEDPNAAA